MDGFIKRLLEKAEAEGRVHVVEIKSDESKDEPKKVDLFAEAKKEAEEIAELNKILYEAHICAGFTSAEALALTVATIK